jgi:hypothetical protein
MAPDPSATPAVRSRNSRRSMTRLYASKGPYELDVTAPRRRSAVALPQREIASAAEEIPPSHHNRPIPKRYRAPIPIQLNMSRA